MSKLFPKIYDTFMSPLEKGSFQEIRKALLREVAGTVLEIGCGTGVNFPLYKKAAQVTAIDPETEMLRRAEKRIPEAQVPIRLELASAEALPYPNGAFDNVVCTLVLCTVPHPELAIQEIKRVCKPGGRIFVFEHVKVNHQILGGLQEILTPLWKHLCDGCHLNRDTVGLLESAGLKIVEQKELYQGIFVVMVLEVS